MKKLLILTLLLFSFLAEAQTKIGYTRNKEYTTAERNAINVSDTTVIYRLRNKDTNQWEEYNRVSLAWEPAEQIPDLSNYATLNTAQTFSAIKTMGSSLYFNDELYITNNGSYVSLLSNPLDNGSAIGMHFLHNDTVDSSKSVMGLDNSGFYFSSETNGIPTLKRAFFKTTNLTNNSYYQMPAIGDDVERVLPVSVNGVLADNIGNITISTGGSTTLQQAVDNGNTVSLDSGNSTVSFLTGTTNNRTFDVFVGSGTGNDSSLNLTPLASSFINETGTDIGGVLINSGLITLAQTAVGVGTTTVGFDTPTGSTTINFPAKSPGSYTLATTDDLIGSGNVNNTGTPLINQIPIFTNATTIKGEVGFEYLNGNLKVPDDEFYNSTLSLGVGTLVYHNEGIGSWTFSDKVYAPDATTSTGLVTKGQMDAADAALILGNGASPDPEEIVTSGGETTWVLPNPITNSHQFFVNGLLQKVGVDYTWAGSTITYLTTITAGELHRYDSNVSAFSGSAAPVIEGSWLMQAGFGRYYYTKTPEYNTGSAFYQTSATNVPAMNLSGATGIGLPITDNKTISSIKGTIIAEQPFTTTLYFVKKHQEFITADFNITAADNTLTTSTYVFVAGDVGKTIRVVGAGVGGIVLTTTIASFTGANEVELTAPADTTVASVDGALETNTLLYTSPSISVKAFSPTIIDITGISFSLPEGDRLIISNMEPTSTAKPLTLSLKLYE